MNPLLALCQKLIQCPSVTPTEGGALKVLQEVLEPLGFTCHLKVFSPKGDAPVSNLYAVRGSGPFNFCFAGHTDVVPPGDWEAWHTDPFKGEIKDGILYGRGAVDMKGAIGAYVSALTQELPLFPAGWEDHLRLSLLLTGDEEGPAVYGTAAMLPWLKEQGEDLSFCLIGEPTSGKVVGDTLKRGRRGSFHASVVSRGRQGHTAYPHLAQNPIPPLVAFLQRVATHPLDEGTDLFPPSSLQITTVDVGNGVTNIIPAEARAHINIRYNPLHTEASLREWLEKEGQEQGIQVSCHSSGEAFLSRPHPLQEEIGEAVTRVCGVAPQVSTEGGTSDGRFISQVCPVLELGLLNKTAHQINEHVSEEDLRRLTEIYASILRSVVQGAL